MTFLQRYLLLRPPNIEVGISARQPDTKSMCAARRICNKYHRQQLPSVVLQLNVYIIINFLLSQDKSGKYPHYLLRQTSNRRKAAFWLLFHNIPLVHIDQSAVDICVHTCEPFVDRPLRADDISRKHGNIFLHFFIYNRIEIFHFINTAGCLR